MAWTDEFLSLHYNDEILDLGGSYPARSSLLIDLNLLNRFNLDKYEQIKQQHDIVIHEMEDALKNWSFPFEVEGKFEPVVRVCSSDAPVRIRDLRNIHVGNLINVTGIVLKITEVSPKIITAVFECLRCNHMTNIPQNGNKFLEPLECENQMCGRKGPFKLLVSESTFVDAQKIRLQESPEDLRGGEQPQTLDIEIEGDIAGQVLPGNRVIVTGILRSIQKITKQTGKTSQFDKMFEGSYIQVSNNNVEIVISQHEQQQLQEIAARPDVIDFLVDHFAASIYGYHILKESLLVCAVSGENHILPDGTLQRGYAHMLICGDPSTAKSTLLQNLKMLIPGAQFATGDGATRAGLTASVVRDDFYGSRWSVEAGALVMADRSVAIIDELDKIRTEDVPKMNTALSSSTVPVNKAGINCVLWARCPIICAMNPKFGRFDIYEPLPGQVVIRADTMSRFDLIYLMRDIPNRAVDDHISDTLIEAWCGPGKSDINIDLLRKYLVSARQIKTAQISDEAQALIKQFYLKMRSQYNPGQDVIPITSRRLEALIRLTRAEAKLRLSVRAEKQDVLRAIKLIEESMQEVCIDDTGKLDEDRVELGKGKSQREMAKFILDSIRELQDDIGAKYSDILLRADEAGFTKERYDKTLEILKREGHIYESKSGFFRAV